MTMAMQARQPDAAARFQMFVLYHSPADYPGQWVLRRWEVLDKGERESPEAWASPCSPEPLRQICRARGMVCLPRHDGDDLAIVETWL